MGMPEIAVMISIRPEWCMLISQGKKTVEVRKTRPKLETPFKCYIYCTMDYKGHTVKMWASRGHVIGEFVCDAIFPICIEYSDQECEIAKHEFTFTGLTDKQIINYLGNGKEGYGWHISDLVIYDEPKYIGDFKVEVNTKQWCFTKKLERPPQSWCYVMEG
jgi:predicted transcriptional regulator